MKDRDSKEWRDCHAIADQLTARTCFEFEPRGQSSAVGARMKGHVSFTDKVGLDFNCYVLRWVGGDAHLSMRGTSSMSLPVGGRGWLAQMIELIVPRIEETAQRWARAAAFMLESDAAPHAHVLLGVSPFGYLRHQLPPGWTTRDLVQQPRRDEDPLPDLTCEGCCRPRRTGAPGQRSASRCRGERGAHRQGRRGRHRAHRPTLRGARAARRAAGPRDGDRRAAAPPRGRARPAQGRGDDRPRQGRRLGAPDHPPKARMMAGLTCGG